MSAREHLLWLARVGENTYGPDASDAIDAYAHELAEKIRAHKDEARGAVQATKVVDFCADLIDPNTTA